MQNDPLRQREAKVDAKTAEEALALAIRLQQERGDHVSIEQVKKTADEAGIEREYIEEALSRIQAEKNPVQRRRLPREKRVLLAFAMAIMFSILYATALATQASQGPLTPLVAAFTAILMVVIIRLRRDRRR